MSGQRPGQADEIPDAYARYIRVTLPTELHDFADGEIAGRWHHLTGPAEREFWRSISAPAEPKPAQTPERDTRAETGGIEVSHDPEIPVRLVQVWLCDLCIDGNGEECHTPGCALWLNRPPERSIRDAPGVTIAIAAQPEQAAPELRAAMADEIASLEASARASAPSKKSDIETGVANRLRKLLA